MEQKKTEKLDEKKKKIIFLSVIGVVILIMLGFAIADVNKEKEEITELEVPVTDDSKLDSKTQAMGIDSTNNVREVDLNTIYQDKGTEKSQEQEDKEVEEIRKKLVETSNGSNNQQVVYKKEKVVEVPKERTYTTVRASKTNKPTVEHKEIKEEVKPVVTQKTKSNSGFFKRANTPGTSLEDLNIYACIHANQTIMNNQRVKFRTTKAFTYNNEVFPVNTVVYGLAQIRPNRLIIKINRINQTDIKLDVYDSEDSEQGLYVLTPNLNASLQKELNKETLNDDDLKKIPFSKSLKSVFEKKVREEKVQLINNYKVLIKISKDEKG
jgi:hypothetical protein